MFSSAVQPSVVSLFSSTSSDPLNLSSSHFDTALPSDSFICLLKDSTSLPHPTPPATLISSSREPDEEANAPDYALDQTVLHIQSPTLETTYIRCPPLGWKGTFRAAHGRSGDLGMQHPWIHLQVRNMGREWSFELGLVDQTGREGIVRCSTFQIWLGDIEPRLRMDNPPLLHLPLVFPPPSSRPLTAWCTISLNLPSLLPHFSSASLTYHGEDGDGDTEQVSERNVGRSHVAVPSGTYSHVSFIKVYATCRLRRIWFSEGGPKQKLPWEFQLYAAD